MKKLTINQFLHIAKMDPDSWKGYCEILIDNDGFIILARPSHYEALLEYYCNKENITRDQAVENIPISYSPLHFIVDKYNIISVWYNSIIYSYDNMNYKQKHVLDKLLYHHLISSSVLYNQQATREYRLYLERKNKYKSIRFDCVYVNTNLTKFNGFSEESVEVTEILNLLLKYADHDSYQHFLKLSQSSIIPNNMKRCIGYRIEARNGFFIIKIHSDITKIGKMQIIYHFKKWLNNRIIKGRYAGHNKFDLDDLLYYSTTSCNKYYALGKKINKYILLLYYYIASMN